MQLRCPNCGALLYSGEKLARGQLPKKCWMCMNVVTSRASKAKPAPRTAVRDSARASERRRSPKWVRDSTSETKSLEIRSDQAIKIGVVIGNSQGMAFELSRPLMTIGRVGGAADIQIDDPEVSRLHCSVGVRGDAMLLRDLRFTNGTFVDGSRVLSARLENRSQFRIDSSYLRIEILASGGQNPNS